MTVGEIELRLPRLRAATSGPGPLLALQSDVPATDREFRRIRARLTDDYVPRRPTPDAP